MEPATPSPYGPGGSGLPAFPASYPTSKPAPVPPEMADLLRQLAGGPSTGTTQAGTGNTPNSHPGFSTFA